MWRAISFLASLTLALAVVPAAPGATDARTRACVRDVITEWRTGPIATSHPVSCYRAALKSLPEDMLIYSDAQNQIERALHVRLAASAREAQGAVDPTDADSSFPLAVIVIAAGSFVFVLVASTSRLARRLRR
jgi:hypothetical protein